YLYDGGYIFYLKERRIVMNEKQRQEQAQIKQIDNPADVKSDVDNIERLKNTSSDDMIAKYFQTSYQPPNINQARKRYKEDVQFHYDFSIPDEMQNIGKNKKFLIRTYGCQMN